ncbi:MAG: glycosyltransferase [Turicibacter sp.]|nr:glycosyltransferase [Turicibacter sp.]
MKIAAGIVTFNPNIERLMANLKAVTPQVQEVFIVDNGSNNSGDIKVLIEKFTNITLMLLRDNKGIATALNEIGNWANLHQYEWFLTLDQDSVVEPGLVNAYRSYLSFALVGQIDCTIVDRGNDELICSIKPGLEYEVVEDTITSGSLVRTEAFLAVGGFDDKMFIDRVDYDFNFRLISHGFETIRIGFVGLYHELGKFKAVNFLGKTYSIVSHSPFRYYYILRNEIILIRRYKDLPQFNAKQHRKELLTYVRNILVLDNNKLKNFLAFFRGALAGVTFGDIDV